MEKKNLELFLNYLINYVTSVFLITKVEGPVTGLPINFKDFVIRFFVVILLTFSAGTFPLKEIHFFYETFSLNFN